MLQTLPMAIYNEPTTHDDPIFIKHDVLHYAVPNIPAAVPRTATIGVTNVTVLFALQIANKGAIQAIKDNQSLASGLNVFDGEVTNKAVANSLNEKYAPVQV